MSCDPCSGYNSIVASGEYFQLGFQTWLRDIPICQWQRERGRGFALSFDATAIVCGNQKLMSLSYGGLVLITRFVVGN
jgi:hypothetical protein